jgi:hypothetical protein
VAENTPWLEALAYIQMQTGLPLEQAEDLLSAAMQDGRVRWEWVRAPDPDAVRGDIALYTGGVTTDFPDDPPATAKVVEVINTADLCRWVRGLGSKAAGGRTPKADWDAYFEAFLAKCEADGVPDKLNVEGWQKQADVERYLEELCERDGTRVGTTTIRDHAREFLVRAKRDLKKDGN